MCGELLDRRLLYRNSFIIAQSSAIVTSFFIHTWPMIVTLTETRAIKRQQANLIQNMPQMLVCFRACINYAGGAA